MKEIQELRARKYFPLENGLYEVAPGLRPLGAEKLFQFDADFFHFREQKLRACQENLQKYYPDWSQWLTPAEVERVSRFIAAKLVQEWPQFFSWDDPESTMLRCHLTGDLIRSDKNPREFFDQLARQVPEDLAIWKWDREGGREYLGALHLCFPNHWSAEEKIGRAFVEVHRPVAGFESIARNTEGMLRAMVYKGPFERFAWGIGTDTRLNHHPVAPPDVKEDDWRGRSFDPQTPQLFLRVERQTLHPFPEEGLSLFSIRSYFYAVAELAPEEIQKLISAIDSMSDAALHYKGLSQNKEAVQAYLRSL